MESWPKNNINDEDVAAFLEHLDFEAESGTTPTHLQKLRSSLAAAGSVVSLLKVTPAGWFERGLPGIEYTSPVGILGGQKIKGGTSISDRLKLFANQTNSDSDPILDIAADGVNFKGKWGNIPGGFFLNGTTGLLNVGDNLDSIFNNDLTVECYLNFTESRNNYILAKMDGAANYYGWKIYIENITNKLIIEARDASGALSVVLNDGLAANIDNHILIIKPDNTGEDWAFHINGVNAAYTASYTGYGGAATSETDAYIGKNTYSEDFFKGFIYQIRLLSRAVTTAEAIKLYNNGRPDLADIPYTDKWDNVMAIWLPDRAAASSWFDISLNELHAVTTTALPVGITLQMLLDLKADTADLGDAALLDVGTATGEVAAGDHIHSGVYEPADATILKDADIGVNVEAYDATILKDADIGVSVEAYDATILKDADIGVSVAAENHTHSGVYEPADATILKDADIGVSVEAYDATILKDADIGTTAGTVAAGNHTHSGVYEPIGSGGLSINKQTDSYNAVAGDKNKVIVITKSTDVTFSIPTDVSFDEGAKMYLVQGGAGQIHYLTSGAAIKYFGLGSSNSFRTKGIHSRVELIKIDVDNNVWSCAGDIQQRSAVFGYFAGGDSSAVVATTDTIVFSTGVTSANAVSNLSQVRRDLSGVSDGSTYGYFAGGYTGAEVATTDRIVFSTGVTSANTVSNLSQAKFVSAGVSDGSTYGYFAGGYTSAEVATTDRIVFSTGVTSANAVSNLSQVRRNLSGVSDGSTYGYFAGGYTGAAVATTDRIVFSTGVTSANTVSNLSQARYDISGVSDGSTYGYFASGYSSAVVATTDRIVFSTGITSANTVSNLSQARYGLSGVSDGSTYGYFAGGRISAAVATTDRIVFSTGVTSANTVSNLSQARYGLSGISDFAA